MQALAARASGFLTLEAIATQLHTYESGVVPGLLQTEAYVRAIHQRAHAGIGSTEIDRLVEVRMTRQQVLRRAQAPLKLTAIVNESLLRRRVGNAQVMRGQLEHIAVEVTLLRNGVGVRDSKLTDSPPLRRIRHSPEWIPQRHPDGRPTD
ncbi:DUF5753 domain-containing protein [Streptomyces maoxianensis]|uniref:DUF5753 domain-containing protein n=1 Tax=Streptomyces maoxianensis TaxID=1459942 RepID=A0ABV9G7L5_9ACTN